MSPSLFLWLMVWSVRADEILRTSRDFNNFDANSSAVFNVNLGGQPLVDYNSRNTYSDIILYRYNGINIMFEIQNLSIFIQSTNNFET